MMLCIGVICLYRSSNLFMLYEYIIIYSPIDEHRVVSSFGVLCKTARIFLCKSPCAGTFISLRHIARSRISESEGVRLTLKRNYQAVL